MNPDFSVQAIEAAQAHALAEYPKESCGLMIDGGYVAVANVSEEPEEAFRMPDDTWLKYQGKIQAVVHSHTGPRDISKPGVDQRAPSASDMKYQMELGFPYGIVWASGNGAMTDPIWFGDFVLDWPLLGREFLSGVTDCYSIIRASFWQQEKIKILDFPRDQNWWETEGANLYLDNYDKAGFKKIDPAAAKAGDVALIRAAGSKVPNHAARLIGGGLILEHMQGQLSRRTPLLRWRESIDCYVRYSP